MKRTIRKLNKYCMDNDKAIRLDKVSRRLHRETRFKGYLGKTMSGGYNYLPTLMFSALDSLVFAQIKPIKVIMYDR